MSENSSSASSFRVVIPSLAEVEARQRELDKPSLNHFRGRTATTNDSSAAPSASSESNQPRNQNSTTAPFPNASVTSVATGSTSRTANTVDVNRTTDESVLNDTPETERVVPNYAYRPNLPNAVVVNSCQRGNPILGSIRNVSYEYGDIVPDYVVGQTSCVIFLSLKYHRLHPEYILDRVTALGNMYVLRVLLCMVDVENHQEPLRDLNKLCVQAGMTLILSWSQEEAGRYLETLKSFEHKSPDMIRERLDDGGNYLSRLTSVLTSIKSVNKTDVITLASNFGSLRRIANCSPEDLALCPGFGEQKVRRLKEAFEEPFQLSKRRRRRPADDTAEARNTVAGAGRRTGNSNAMQTVNHGSANGSVMEDRLDAALLAKTKQNEY